MTTYNFSCNARLNAAIAPTGPAPDTFGFSADVLNHLARTMRFELGLATYEARPSTVAYFCARKRCDLFLHLRRNTTFGYIRKVTLP